MPQQAGVSHIALTVTDAARSAAWYQKVLEGQPFFQGDDEHGHLEINLHGNLLLGFRTHPGTGKKDRFDPARVGLDHLSIACESAAELEKWRARLDENGVTHSGIQESPWGLHLNMRDPDDIQIELFVAPQQG
ncbi:MAG TPA: VOC family protein [Actinomycetota bacterium]